MKDFSKAETKVDTSDAECVHTEDRGYTPARGNVHGASETGSSARLGGSRSSGNKNIRIRHGGFTGTALVVLMSLVMVLGGTIASFATDVSTISGVDQGSDQYSFLKNAASATIDIDLDALNWMAGTSGAQALTTDSMIPHVEPNGRNQGIDVAMRNDGLWHAVLDPTMTTTGKLEPDIANQFMGQLYSTTYKNAATLPDGTKANVRLLFSDLEIFVGRTTSYKPDDGVTPTGRDTNRRLESDFTGKVYISSGTRIRALSDQRIPSNQYAENVRHGIKVKVTGQIVDDEGKPITSVVIDGKEVPAIFYFPMTDIDVVRNGNPNFDSLSQSTTTSNNNYENGSGYQATGVNRSFSEQYRIETSQSGIVTDQNGNFVYVPGAPSGTSHSNYTLDIATDTEGLRFYHGEKEGSLTGDGDIDPGTYRTGFVAPIDNSKGITLTGWLGGGSPAPVATTLFSAGNSVKVWHKIKSSTTLGGTIQTTEYGNKNGNLKNSGSVLQPGTYLIPEHRDTIYTMTPEQGHEVSEIKIGDGIVDAASLVSVDIEKLKRDGTLPVTLAGTRAIQSGEDKSHTYTYSDITLTGTLTYDSGTGVIKMLFPDNSQHHTIHVAWRQIPEVVNATKRWDDFNNDFDTREDILFHIDVRSESKNGGMTLTRTMKDVLPAQKITPGTTVSDLIKTWGNVIPYTAADGSTIERVENLATKDNQGNDILWESRYTSNGLRYVGTSTYREVSGYEYMGDPSGTIDSRSKYTTFLPKTDAPDADDSQGNLVFYVTENEMRYAYTSEAVAEADTARANYLFAYKYHATGLYQHTTSLRITDTLPNETDVDGQGNRGQMIDEEDGKFHVVTTKDEHVVNVLPRYDEDGGEIQYIIRETLADGRDVYEDDPTRGFVGYTTEVLEGPKTNTVITNNGVRMNAETQNYFVDNNLETISEENNTELSVTKKWLDEETIKNKNYTTAHSESEIVNSFRLYRNSEDITDIVWDFAGSKSKVHDEDTILTDNNNEIRYTKISLYERKSNLSDGTPETGPKTESLPVYRSADGNMLFYKAGGGEYVDENGNEVTLPSNAVRIAYNRGGYESVMPAGTEDPFAEGWYEYDASTGAYTATTDTVVDPTKTYYRKLDDDELSYTYERRNVSYNQVMPIGTENPLDEGWYEDNQGTTPSQDTSVDATKTYFEKVESTVSVTVKFKEYSDAWKNADPTSTPKYVTTKPSGFNDGKKFVVIKNNNDGTWTYTVEDIPSHVNIAGEIVPASYFIKEDDDFSKTGEKYLEPTQSELDKAMHDGEVVNKERIVVKVDKLWEDNDDELGYRDDVVFHIDATFKVKDGSSTVTGEMHDILPAYKISGTKSDPTSKLKSAWGDESDYGKGSSDDRTLDQTLIYKTSELPKDENGNAISYSQEISEEGLRYLGYITYSEVKAYAEVGGTGTFVAELPKADTSGAQPRKLKWTESNGVFSATYEDDGSDYGKSYTRETVYRYTDVNDPTHTAKYYKNRPTKTMPDTKNNSKEYKLSWKRDEDDSSKTTWTATVNDGRGPLPDVPHLFIVNKLPRYDAEGNEIVYTIRETLKDGKSSVYENDPTKGLKYYTTEIDKWADFRTTTENGFVTKTGDVRNIINTIALVGLKVDKVIDGRTFKSSDDFEFVLTGENNTPMPVKTPAEIDDTSKPDKVVRNLSETEGNLTPGTVKGTVDFGVIAFARSDLKEKEITYKTATKAEKASVRYWTITDQATGDSTTYDMKRASDKTAFEALADDVKDTAKGTVYSNEFTYKLTENPQDSSAGDSVPVTNDSKIREIKINVLYDQMANKMLVSSRDIANHTQPNVDPEFATGIDATVVAVNDKTKPKAYLDVVTFENTYESEGTLMPEAVKTLNGRPLERDQFKFYIKAVDTLTDGSAEAYNTPQDAAREVLKADTPTPGKISANKPHHNTTEQDVLQDVAKATGTEPKGTSVLNGPITWEDITYTQDDLKKAVLYNADPTTDQAAAGIRRATVNNTENERNQVISWTYTNGSNTTVYGPIPDDAKATVTVDGVEYTDITYGEATEAQRKAAMGTTEASLWKKDGATCIALTTINETSGTWTGYYGADGTTRKSVPDEALGTLYLKERTFSYDLWEDVPDNAVNAGGTQYSEATQTQKDAGGFTLDGYTYDSKYRKVQVKIKEELDGTISKTVKVDGNAVSNGDPLTTFANKYEAEGVLKLSIKKSLDDTDQAILDSQKAEFTLSAVTSGAPMPEGTGNVKELLMSSSTLGTDGKWTVTFDDIKFTQANLMGTAADANNYIASRNKDGLYERTFVYKIVETAMKAAGNSGVTSDPDSTIMVAVTFREDNKGHLKVVAVNNLEGSDIKDPLSLEVEDATPAVGATPAKPTTSKVNAGEFTNKYQAAGTATIKATKKLFGRDLEDGQFEFVLKDEQITGDNKVVHAVKNGSDGLITFRSLTYTLDDLTKTSNPSGTDTANEYGVTKGKKYKIFTYKIAEVVPHEDMDNDAYTYGKSTSSDTAVTEKTVTVLVYDKGDGTLGVKYNKDGDTTANNFKDTLNDDDVTINNMYEASGEAPIEGTKVLTGRTLKKDEFTFIITPDKTYAADGTSEIKDDGGNSIKPPTPVDASNNAVTNVQNAADGSIDFGTVKFTMDDLKTETTTAGVTTVTYDKKRVFTYKLKETQHNDDSITTWDLVERTVKVTVEDMGDGTLKVTPAFDAISGVSDSSVWTNAVELIEITVTKTWYGVATEDVKVTMQQNNGTLTANWEDVSFEGKDWTHTFKAGEFTTDGQKDATYKFEGLQKFDSSGKEIEYRVHEDAAPSGAQYIIAQNDAELDKAYTVINVNRETIEVDATKVWNDDNDRDGKRTEAKFTISNNGTALTTNDLPRGTTAEQTVAVPASGDAKTVKWTVYKYLYEKDGDTITFSKPTYKIKETTVPTDYTPVPAGTTDAESGLVEAGGTITNKYTPEKANILVTKKWDDDSNRENKRKDDETKVYLYKKVWVGDRTGGAYSTTETLVSVDPKVVPITADSTTNETPVPAGATYTWNDLPVYENGHKILYIVKEEHVAGYATEYDHKAGGTGTYDPGTVTDPLTTKDQIALMKDQTGKVKVTNKLTLSHGTIRAYKVWDDENDKYGMRPGSVEFTLYDKSSGTPKKVVKDVGGNAITNPVTLDGTADSGTANGRETEAWKATWSKLPEYAENDTQKGVAAQYVIIETYDGTDLKSNGYSAPVVSYGGLESEGFFGFKKIDVVKVTNSYVPELTSVDAEKNWVDNDNHDGIRPNFIVLTLQESHWIKGSGGNQGSWSTVADVDPAKTLTLTNAGSENNWTGSIDGLPKYMNGKAVKYSFTEKTVPADYTKTETTTEATGTAVAKTTVTNTHGKFVGTVEVTKIWEDQDNKYNKRPSTTEFKTMIQLKDDDGNPAKNAAGNVVEPSVTQAAGSGNENKYVVRWENVLVYKADGRSSGDKIVYSIEETDLNAGYKIVGQLPKNIKLTRGTNNIWSAQEGITLTNRLTTLDLPLRKIWIDYDVDETSKNTLRTIRPASVTLRVTADTEMKNATGTALAGWTVGTGTSYIDIVLDSNNKIDDTGIRTGVVWYKLDDKLKDLPMYKADGTTAITYTISEPNVPANYEQKNALTNETNAIVNVYKGVKFTGTKEWKDGKEHNTAKELRNKLVLHRDWTPAGGTLQTETVDNFHIDWTDDNFEIIGLPKYDEDGNEYSYWITEEQVSGYDVPVYDNSNAKAQGDRSKTDALYDGGKVKNTIKQEPVEIDGDKKWIGGEDSEHVNTTLNLTLYRRSAKSGSSIESGNDIKKVENTGTTADPVWEVGTVAASETWDKGDQSTGDDTYKFSDLPKYDAEGYEYTYWVVEGTIPQNYAVSYRNDADHLNATDKVYDGGTITNTTTKKDSIKVSKTWDDKDASGKEDAEGLRPTEVTVHLYKMDGTNQISAGQDEKVLNTANNWTATWTNLPVYDADGTKIEYVVVEEAVSGYTTTYDPADNKTKLDGNTGAQEVKIKNALTPAVTKVTVEKIWDDNDNIDGKRPTSVEIKLYERVWNKTSKAYNDEAAAKYVDGTAVPALTLDGTADGGTENVKETAAWKGEFDKLAQTKNGKTVIYYVKETPIVAEAGYKTAVVQGNQLDGFKVTNTREKDKTSATITKVWVDNDNVLDTRPDTLTMTLMRKYTDENGDVQHEAVDKDIYNNAVKSHMSDDDVDGTNTNKWTATINNLPKSRLVGTAPNQTPAEYTYYWKETIPTGYTAASSKDTSGNTSLTEAEIAADNGETITNTYKKGKITVVKTWDDRNDVDKKREAALAKYESQLTLFADDTKVTVGSTTGITQSKAVTSGNTTTIVFDNLPIYDKGTQITYTVDEGDIPEYELTAGPTTSKIDDTTGVGLNITLTNKHEIETVDMPVRVSWVNDKDALDGTTAATSGLTDDRPTEITVTLQMKDENGKWVDVTTKADGTTIPSSITLDSGDEIDGDPNNWGDLDTWSGLAKNGADGKPIKYRIIQSGYETVDETVAPSKASSDNGDKGIDGETVAKGSTMPARISGYMTVPVEFPVSGNLTTFVNTYETTTITGTKVWVDPNPDKHNNSADIKFKVERREPGASTWTTLKEDTDYHVDWSTVSKKDDTFKIRGLTKYVDPNATDKVAYEYRVTEIVPDGYDAVYPNTTTAGTGYLDKNGGEIKNIIKQDYVKIDVTKKWVGHPVKDVEVELLADGKKVAEHEFKVSDFTTPDKKVTYTFTRDNGTGVKKGYEKYDLDPNSANYGKEIVYTANETTSGDFTTTYSDDKLTITNNSTEKITVEAIKKWEGDNDAKDRRDDVEFKLIQTIDGASKPVADYTTQVDGRDVDVTGTQTIPADKSVKAGEEAGRVTWPNLPVTDSNGNDITYTVEEIAAPEGYSMSGPTGIGTKADPFVITNTLEKDTINVPVMVKWDDSDDNDGIRPSSTEVVLEYYDVETDEWKAYTVDGYKANMTLDESNNWKHLFKDLPKTDKNGKPIEYKVVETRTDVLTGDDTATTYDIEEVGDSKNPAAGFKITNIHSVDKRIIEATKVWDDDDDAAGLRDDVILHLYGMYDGLIVYDGGTKKIAKDASGDDLTVIWKNIPAKHYDNDKLEWKIVEEPLFGYTTEITGNAEDGFEVLNTYVGPVENIKVTKEWDDANDTAGKRPAKITYILWQKIGDDAPTKYKTETVNVDSKTGEAEHEWTGLPVTENKVVDTTSETRIEYVDGEKQATDASGNLAYEEIASGIIIYVDPASQSTYDQDDSYKPLMEQVAKEVEDTIDVTEEVPILYCVSEEYESADEKLNLKKLGYDQPQVEAVAPGEFNVINRRDVPKTSVAVKKVWNDNNDEAGVRPDHVDFILKADGEQIAIERVDAEDEWKYTFDNLDKTDAAGNTIKYTVEEKPVPDYTTVGPTGDGSEDNPYVFTNTYNVKTINLKAIKKWAGDEDNKDKRKDVTFNLVKVVDGESSVVEGKEKVVKADKDAKAGADAGSVEWANLPTKENGKDVSYTVQEDVVAGYKTSISDVKRKSGDNFEVVVTNDYNEQPQPIENLRGDVIYIDPMNGKGKMILRSDSYDTYDLAGEAARAEKNKPADPSHKGVKFLGWNLNYDENGNYVLVAMYSDIPTKFTPVTSYIDPQSGLLISEETNDPMSVIPPSDPKYPNLVFKGWKKIKDAAGNTIYVAEYGCECSNGTPKSVDKSNVNTGDETMIYVWLWILLLSAVSLVMTAIIRNRSFERTDGYKPKH